MMMFIGPVVLLAIMITIAVVVNIFINHQKSKTQNRPPSNPQNPFGIPMPDKKVPRTGRRFVGDDDSGRKEG